MAGEKTWRKWLGFFLIPRCLAGFTGEELTARMQLSSPELINEVYQIAKQEVDAETRRQTRLEAKATSLLTASGLSVTLAVSLGGLMLRDSTAWVTLWLKALLIIGVVFGLAAALSAAAALLVKGHWALSERNVFDTAVLNSADQAASEMVGSSEYQRFMTVQLWWISQQHSNNRERQAWIVKRGQLAYIAFLTTLLLICLSLAFGVNSKSGNQETPEAASCAGAVKTDPGVSPGRRKCLPPQPTEGYAQAQASTVDKEKALEPSVESGTRALSSDTDGGIGL